jgi:hypothetical protein
MKKILAALLLVMYFTVSTGFVVSLHYCMDRFDSAKLGKENSDKCDKCGMHKSENKCCHDEIKVVKLHTTHIASGYHFNFTIDAAPQLIAGEFLVSPFRNFTTTDAALAHGPPLSDKDVYLQNCVFRI